jgi:hypothetical protein
MLAGIVKSPLLIRSVTPLRSASGLLMLCPIEKTNNAATTMLRLTAPSETVAIFYSLTSKNSSTATGKSEPTDALNGVSNRLVGE